MALHIVLHQPEIPQNTGNIARSCVAVGAELHLIRPLGFELTDKYLRRAGMDYWQKLTYHVWDSLADFFSSHPGPAAPYPDGCYFVSTKARRHYSSLNYPEDCWFLFGRESAGLPEELMRNSPGNSLRIPIRQDIRSLNLSNAAAIIMFEYWRQRDFHF